MPKHALQSQKISKLAITHDTDDSHDTDAFFRLQNRQYHESGLYFLYMFVNGFPTKRSVYASNSHNILRK